VGACATPVANVGGVSGDATSATASADESSSTGARESSSSGDPQDTTSSVDPGESSSSGNVGGEAPLLDVGSADTGVFSDGCDEDAPSLIHLLSLEDEIWTFDPIAFEFTLLTHVDCPEIAGYPTGFAIDRGGDIWVVSYEYAIVDEPVDYQTMQLSRFAPGDANCEVVFQGQIVGQNSDPEAGYEFGIDCADLAFVTTGDDAGTERLFAHRCTGGGFGTNPGLGALFRLDPADDEPSFTWLDSDAYTSVPITGTGDGRLFGISGDPDAMLPTQVLQYDQDSGAVISSVPAPEIDLGISGPDLALAFYAGDLYTFGATPDYQTVIHRYDLDDDDGDGDHEVELVGEGPLRVFAAASPTCIPLAPAG
jgi:hypothetical protein